MKIIAKARDDVFIVEARGDELAQVMGHNSAYALKDRTAQLAIGVDIKVSPLYQALQVSRQRKAEITQLAEALRKVAGRVDSINQALAEPIVEVEKAG